MLSKTRALKPVIFDFSGVPSCQRTIAFEKACTLFNLGAIYTQIGARHDRSTEKGLDAAVDSFLRAAGIFRHIYDTFTNAPSMDLKPQVLDVLVSLMLSQARECLFEKLQLQIESLGLTESSHVSFARCELETVRSSEYQISRLDNDPNLILIVCSAPLLLWPE